MCYDGRVALLILRTANGKSSELVRFGRLDVAARRLRSSRHLVRPEACRVKPFENVTLAIHVAPFDM